MEFTAEPPAEMQALIAHLRAVRRLRGEAGA